MAAPETPDAQRLDKIEQAARKRVEELKGFYIHVGVFLVGMLLLLLINLLTSPGTLWAVWPFLGWGAGVFFHAVSVFGIFGLGGQAWEEQKLREFMRAQHSLDATDVRALLREELDEAALVESPEMRRLRERIENLEAIVTSQTWDTVVDDPAAPNLLDEMPENDADAAERAARLARRIR